MSKKRSMGLIKRGDIWHINKTIAGRVIRRSACTSDLDEAERILARLVTEIREQVMHGATPEVTFGDAALRYVSDECPPKSLEQAKLALRDAEPFIWDMPLDEVHEGTIRLVKEDWSARKLAAGTQNRRLGIYRRILNLAARKWRHENNKPWLATAPLLDAAKGPKKRPYPLSWNEQDALFRLLPDHLAEMALFDVNTGLREQALCELRWEWEVEVPELNTSLFVCPSWMNGKNEDEEYLLILNRVALKVLDARRGTHPEFVFSYNGHKLAKVTNLTWRKAWKAAGLPVDDRTLKGVHNLRHTFGHRLRAAGVSPEDRKDLMWHTNGDMSRHYATPDVVRLQEAANSIFQNRATVLRAVR